MRQITSLKHFAALLGAAAILAAPTVSLAGEEHLEFKLITRGVDVKTVNAPNIDGRMLGAGNFFGVAFFKDGRIAAKEFIDEFDYLKADGTGRGYSTYTFEDGSTITASYVYEEKGGKLHGDYTILSGTGRYDKATGTGGFDSLPTKWPGGTYLFDSKFDVKTP